MGNKQKNRMCHSHTEGHNNYGTSLQGYAMLKKIQQLGYEVEVIQYTKRLSVWQKMKFVVNALSGRRVEKHQA